MMHSMLDQLDNPDSIVLMYLSDELPAEDRGRVERMLSQDPELAARLERAREALESLDDAMRRMDAAQSPPGSDAAAIRQIGRSMRQWQTDRTARTARPRPAPGGLRFPWWSYPLSAAAAITFAVLTFWYNLPNPQVVVDRGDSATTSHMFESSRVSVDPIQIEPAPISLVSLDDPRDLSELERELRAVSEMRQWMQ